MNKQMQDDLGNNNTLPSMNCPLSSPSPPGAQDQPPLVVYMNTYQQCGQPKKRFRKLSIVPKERGYSPMPESLLFFSLSGVEQRQEGQYVLWFFPCSQRAPPNVTLISFLVHFASFFQWDHNVAFRQVP